MGTYGEVAYYELQPLPVEALATFRKNLAEYVEKARKNPAKYTPEYADYIEQILAKHEDNFTLLTTLAEDERWGVAKKDDQIVLFPPNDEIKGGIGYTFVDYLCPHVQGFIQVEYELCDDPYRVVWKDGREGRVVNPVWPDPTDEDENE